MIKIIQKALLKLLSVNINIFISYIFWHDLFMKVKKSHFFSIKNDASTMSTGRAAYLDSSTLGKPYSIQA